MRITKTVLENLVARLAKTTNRNFNLVKNKQYYLVEFHENRSPNLKFHTTALSPREMYYLLKGIGYGMELAAFMVRDVIVTPESGGFYYD